MRCDERHAAILLKDLEGGGVQKVGLVIARALRARGCRVELLAMRPEGVLAAEVPADVPVLPLTRAGPVAWRRAALAGGAHGAELVRRTLWPGRADEALAYLPALAGYLRRERPAALLAATPYINLTALLARRIAGVPTRVLVSEHNDLSHGHPLGRGRERRRLVALMQLYGEADMVVAVSHGVARDVSARSRLPEERIVTVYNPAVSPEVERLAAEPLDDPWLAPGAPPVILAVGQLSARKDYPTLIRALALLRAERNARLVILGKAGDAAKTERERRRLIDFAAAQGVEEAMAVPGFALNPYRYMAHAGVLALSSRHEGFGNVIAEALACGCPVVSTDCPSGPAEILDDGRFGALVPVGDPAAMARAIATSLDAPPPAERLRARAQLFSVGRAVDRYEEILLGSETGVAAASA